jgi:hypothetical protein
MKKILTTGFSVNSLHQFYGNIFGEFYFDAPNAEHTTDEGELRTRKETKAHIS